MGLDFPRVKGAGWAFGEVLTSAQMNALDIDHANSVSGTAGTLGVEAVTRTRPAASLLPVDVTKWSPYLADSGMAQVALVNTAAQLHYVFEPPDGATITGWTVYLDGGSGHSGLPGTPPSASLFLVGLADGVATLIGAAGSDASASVPAYEANHTIAKTGLSHAVDRDVAAFYQLTVNNESGANAEALLTVYGVTLTMSIPRLDYY